MWHRKMHPGSPTPEIKVGDSVGLDRCALWMRFVVTSVDRDSDTLVWLKVRSPDGKERTCCPSDVVVIDERPS
jgi:hypothetical protein